MKFSSCLVLAAVSLHACTAVAGTLDIAVPSEASAGVEKTVQKAWPKALQACPGLTKHAADLSFAGVEDNYGYAPEHAKRIEVMFKVAASPKSIPASYRAAGHTCYYSIASNGSKLTISKSACAAVCNDAPTAISEIVKPL
jgi:hypothetical protein